MNEILNSKKGPWWNGSFWSVGLYLLFLIFSLSGCKDDDRALFGEESEDALQLGAGITGLTRATDVGFEVGDTLGLFAVKWKSEVEQDTLLAAGNYADNVWFRLESMDNNWIPERTIYFPNDDRLLDLYAYYPYRTPAFGTGTVIPVSVEANQSVGNRYTRSDFMVARTASVKRTREKVPLIFDHMLAQMDFVLKPGVGFTLDDLLTAKIKVVNAVIDGTYDLSDAPESKVVTGTIRSDVVPAGSWSKGEGVLTGKLAIVIPQELTPQTYIEVSLGSRRFTYKPSSVQLNPGCSRIFVITVNNTGLDITTRINPWDNCPPVNGDADEEIEAEPIVVMTTLASNVKLSVEHSQDIQVDWGDGVVETNIFSHTYTDGVDSHEIRFWGDIYDITSLSCSNNQLTLLDISNSLELNKLECNKNQLSILDLSKNTKIKNLNCNNNRLTLLDVNNSAMLQRLYCDTNQLYSLNLEGNERLSNLHCRANQLVSLDLSKCPVLSIVYCEDNQLTALNISNNFKLVRLHCSNNQLTSLDVSRDTLLRYIYCNNNQISALDVSRNKLIMILNVNDNQLTSLNINGVSSLRNLNVCNNLLTSLNTSNNENLMNLICNHNRLSSLDVSNNLKLSTLICQDNPLITDQAALAEMANSLPGKTGKDQGVLSIANSTSAAWIQSICDAKNWVIQ